MNVLFLVNFKNSVTILLTQIELIIELKKKGINPLVIGQFSEEVDVFLTQNNIRHRSLFPKYKIDFSYISEIKKLMLQEPIDIVQLLSGKASRNFLLATKKKTVKTVSFMGSISLHWYDPSSYLTYLNPKIDKIICVSDFVHQHVRKQLFGKNKNKAAKIYEGYSSEWFQDTESYDYSSLGIPKDAIVVCFVGNHRKVKGTQYFIKSSYHLSSKKDIHYIIIGHRTKQKEFLNIAEKSPISNNIHFLEVQNNAVSFIKGADIYTQTSISEGLCRAICEAISVAKPVVMTDAGGCTELVDKNSGIVVPLRDPKSIGEAISKLADNQNLRETMGNNGKQRMDTLFNHNTMVEETFKLYTDLLK